MDYYKKSYGGVLTQSFSYNFYILLLSPSRPCLSYGLRACVVTFLRTKSWIFTVRSSFKTFFTKLTNIFSYDDYFSRKPYANLGAISTRTFRVNCFILLATMVTFIDSVFTLNRVHIAISFTIFLKKVFWFKAFTTRFTINVIQSSPLF